MTISAEERERRRKTLGSSDVPAILGLNPWMSGADVQASKLYELEEVEDSAAAKIGNVLESALCQWAVVEDQRAAGIADPEHGYVVVPDGKGLQAVPVEYSPPVVLHDVAPFSANCDAIVPGRCVIEAKTTSLDDVWGTPGTDEVPDAVVTQVQWQLALTRLEFALVPVLFTGLRRDLQLYRVPRNDELIEVLLRHGEDWWVRHVERREPVPPEPPSLDVLKRVRRQPGSSALLPRDLVLAKKETALALKAAKANDDLAKARILERLGDAESGIDEDGNVLCTFLEQHRKEQVVRASTFRVLRLKGGGE